MARQRRQPEVLRQQVERFTTEARTAAGWTPTRGQRRRARQYAERQAIEDGGAHGRRLDANTGAMEARTTTRGAPGGGQRGTPR